jgi:hypothetical protein
MLSQFTDDVVIERDDLLHPTIREVPWPCQRWLNGVRLDIAHIFFPPSVHAMPFVQVMWSYTSGASQPLPSAAGCNAHILPLWEPNSLPIVPARKRPAGSTAPSFRRASLGKMLTVDVGMTRYCFSADTRAPCSSGSWLRCSNGWGSELGGMKAKLSSILATSCLHQYTCHVSYTVADRTLTPSCASSNRAIAVTFLSKWL